MPEPVEAVEMQAALLRLRRTSGLPVAFGGLLSDARHARIAELNGAQTTALRGLVITAGSGLGGKSIALSRPCAVTDYPSSRHISHEYDTAVAAEGLRSVVAVPVVVRRKVRGVLYGRCASPSPSGTVRSTRPSRRPATWNRRSPCTTRCSRSLRSPGTR